MAFNTGGLFKGLSVGSIIIGIIMLAIGLQVAAAVLPVVQVAGDTVQNISGLPFASFFSGGSDAGGSGVVLLAIMGAFILGVIGVLGLTSGKR